MYENQFGARSEESPLINLLVIILMVGLGFIIVGPVIGFFAALPFYHQGGIDELWNAIQQPLGDPGLKIPIYIIQAFATFVGLIVAPAVFLRTRARSLSDLMNSNGISTVPIIVTAFIVIIFMAVNSVFIEWNAKFDFPDFAGEFERWAREREDAATQQTEFLTNFSSLGELMMALVIIAILPAIGEELVFRGLIQNELYRASRNIHVAIWFAAMLFSAIHFQFFGFLPRLLLGALFGYLYYWSGSLLVAIIAHFVNNAVSVVAMYLYQEGKFDFDLESQDSAPASVVLTSAALTAGLLYYFYRFYQDRKTAIQ